ncbi:hypothetical protein RFI_00184, partial [Reticulomyxa filosa]
MKFFQYFIVSSIVAACAIYYAYILHEQFYPTVLHLMTDRLCVLGLGNFGFSLALGVANVIIRVMFVTIQDDESHEVVSKAKYAIIEICIALTSFHSSLTVSVLVLFTCLLFMKIFHWLAQMRMENFARAVAMQISGLRLIMGLLMLLTTDVFIGGILAYISYQEQSVEMQVLFAFEFCILAVSMLGEVSRFIVLTIDRRYEGRWEYKPIVIFRNLRVRVQHFIAYRRIVKVIDTQFPTLTSTEIEETGRDLRCVICFYDMTHGGKELPCRHVFHLSCLKRWFEQKQDCPMCRAKIDADYTSLSKQQQLRQRIGNRLLIQQQR